MGTVQRRGEQRRRESRLSLGQQLLCALESRPQLLRCWLVQPIYRMKRLIVCADDFGLDVAVNEAVEEAHRHGILSCASLMVAGPAAADALARARRLPTLGVGLHL